MQLQPCRITKTRRHDGKTEEFLIRLCGREELDPIMGLQAYVREHLDNPEIFAMTSREEIAESLEQDFCFGAFAGDRLAAFSLVIRNRVTPRNLGAKLGLSNAELMQCVTYDTTFVHPDYRGFGLQAYFMAPKDRLSRESGAAWALCTVDPANPHSLNNVTRAGFTVVKRARLYGGADRYILRKDLESEVDHGRDCSGR